MLNRIPEFEIATRDEGLSWHRIDLSGAFADWMDTFDPIERKDTLADPDIVESYADPGFIEFLSGRLGREMESVPPADAVDTVFAVSGLMDLYDFVHVSEVLATLDSHLRGIVLLFFPGGARATPTASSAPAPAGTVRAVSQRTDQTIVFAESSQRVQETDRLYHQQMYRRDR